MQAYRKIFPAGQMVISLFFVGSAIAIIVFAVYFIWEAIRPASEIPVMARLNAILESMALLTIASAALELGQILIEEEVLRESQMSAPTRVRRFLSRFMVVLVVALSIEALVSVFIFIHEEPEHLPYAASIGLMAAALLGAWGLFVRLNRSAEELEPEAMEKVQQEDEVLED